MARFVARCLILVVCLYLALAVPQQLEILQGWQFFTQPSLLHLLWLVWVGDMALQLIPAKRNIALGSKKLFKQYFTPAQVKHDLEALKRYIAWELSVVLHPERFWFMSNETLRCENCTDKLCTQYCQKLRPGQNQEKKHP